MANRRMFSFRIINSAKFLQMPAESQLLYFHLGIRADDDGVAEAYSVMRLLGSTPDAFKVLIAKGFIQQLNEELVVFITDWQEHNNIRSDRKIDSIYKPLLEEQNIPIKPVKARSDVKDNSARLRGPSTDGIGKVRLGKDRLLSETEVSQSKSEKEPLSSDSNVRTFEVVTDLDADGLPIDKPPRKKAETTNDAPKVFAVFKSTIGNYQSIWLKNRTERIAAQTLYNEKGLDRIRGALEFWRENKDDPYIPEVITPHRLVSKWDALSRYRNKHGL